MVPWFGWQTCRLCLKILSLVYLSRGNPAEELDAIKSLLLHQEQQALPCVEMIVRIGRSHMMAYKSREVNLVFSVT